MEGGNFAEEVEVVQEKEEKNWRGIVISVLVITIVLSLILTAVIIVNPESKDVKHGDPFTFEDIFRNEFQPQKFASQWIGDSDVFIYRSKEGEIMEYDAATNSSQLIMDNSTFRSLNTGWYQVSEDRSYVLIAYNIKKVYRHTFLAKYTIYSRYATNPNKRLIPFPQGKGDWNVELLQFAGWSPKGNSLSFVFRNNLYFQVSPDTTPNWITEDGQERRVFNGIPDWVYEEEILHTSRAHWWSPSNTYLCFAQFDDSAVPTYRFPFYGPGENIYGNIEEFAYPKAGDKSEGITPRVKLFIVTPQYGTSRKQLHPPANLGLDYYFQHLAWQDDEHVFVIWTNRVQNYSVYSICEAKYGDCYINQVENTHEGRGWIDMSKPVFIKDNYLIVHPEQDAMTGYWKHIAIISTPIRREGFRIYITQGQWDVLEILAYNSETNSVYFIGTDNDPKARHLFRVGVNTSPFMALESPECLTCNSTNSSCQYHSASFSHTANYYILECLGPGMPSWTLMSIQDDREIVLEDNVALSRLMSTKALPQRDYIEIDIGDDIKLWAYMDLPPGLNKEHVVQYPMLIHTYGGPGTQLVTYQSQLGWATHLVSQRNVIYVCIDGRGSGSRGQRWLHSNYGSLGTLEVTDQIKAAEYLRNTYSFIDNRRIAIWGWSYGGFVTLHALGDDLSAVFGCGIAVAPVTDWHYYDTVYTERYMNLERHNYKGYDNANVSRKAKNFHGKQLLLVHGTADDNVHFQNSAQFIKALTEAEVDFQMQIYSDKNHEISGPTTSRHLHRTMTRFLMDTCWHGGEPRMEGEDEPPATAA